MSDDITDDMDEAQVRRFANALWNGEFDCARCGHVTNNGICTECRHNILSSDWGLACMIAEAYHNGYEAACLDLY